LLSSGFAGGGVQEFYEFVGDRFVVAVDLAQGVADAVFLADVVEYKRGRSGAIELI
jgi:hypothetical protein